MNEVIQTIQFMIKGVGLTTALYLFTILGAYPLGIALAFLRKRENKIVENIIFLYTWLFRGTPLLLQLFFVYFGLPAIGIRLGAFQSALLAFVLNYGAYMTEIIRGGINAIDKGQWEAAKVLKLSKKTLYMKIILPQAIKNCLPSIANESITLVKDTALVAAIGMGDVLRAAKQVVTRDIVIYPFILAAVFYLIFTAIVVFGFKKIEKYYEKWG
ncbi:MAG: amino acid ABC transporter permease [Tissierellales bacterium]|jgi:polar amino acid transport system permease protein|nr:amino acid ABC transporter permease [Tissierellales bacterium]